MKTFISYETIILHLSILTTSFCCRYRLEREISPNVSAMFSFAKWWTPQFRLFQPKKAHISCIFFAELQKNVSQIMQNILNLCANLSGRWRTKTRCNVTFDMCYKKVLTNIGRSLFWPPLFLIVRRFFVLELLRVSYYLVEFKIYTWNTNSILRKHDHILLLFQCGKRNK